MALPPNSVNMNTSVYMDHFMQVGQPASHTGWYDYHGFNNLLVTQTVPHSQISVPQPIHVHHQEVLAPPPPPPPPPAAPPSLPAPRPKPPPVSRPKPRPSNVERTYYCDACGASFSNSSNLKSHSRIHSGERPYVCELCGSSFVQSSNLKAHKRIHTGERPYMCSECGQTFSRSSHLTGHKRTHTGERPYICGICQDSFVTSTHLRNHMRKHTGERPFTCQICKSTFAQNASLQIHLRIHTGERPYKCTECSATFRSRGDLRSHQKLHTDDRPFSCGRCNKFFKTNQYLQKHLKKCGAPSSGKKRGRPRKILSADSVLLTVPKKKVVSCSSNRGKSRTSKSKPVRVRPRSARITRNAKAAEREECLQEVSQEESNQENEQSLAFVDMINLDKMPKCDILSETLNNSDHLPPTQPKLESHLDPLEMQAQELLPEIKECAEQIDQIANSVMEPVANVDQSLQISHVEHIEHMPIEVMERIWKS